MRQHDGGFLSQIGAQRRNEVNPVVTLKYFFEMLTLI